MADEVYQTNIFQPQDRPFVSFKKVLRIMPAPIANELELFSFNSASKGCVGECGHRGGYFEAVNIEPTILDQLYKMASINLCPNIQGQALVFFPFFFFFGPEFYITLTDHDSSLFII